MKVRFAIAAGTIVVVAALVPAGTARAAGSGTVSGRLAPGTAKLPRSAARGEAQVLAMNIDTAAYGDASPVSKSGRYSLSLPAGKWALRSSVVTLGAPFVSFTSAAIVTRAGQRRSLPLTLKRFKEPRKKRKRRPHAANVNPRDGRPYPGEAFAFETFTVASGNPDLSVLGNGVPDMLTTDIAGKPGCPFTLVEWRRRSAVLDEIALSRTEYVDPASRIEPGHLIDPEVFIRGRVEDRPGTPKRLALVAWLVNAKTGARLSGDVSSVTLPEAFGASAKRLAELILRDLICARANRPAPVPSPAAPADLPPSPPVPTAATNVYTGTFTGEAYSELTDTRWTWSGTARLDAAQDYGPPLPPPNGGPSGSYRIFTVTSGSVDITLSAGSQGGCALNGHGHIELVPGITNQIVVQLDAPNPAYAVHLRGLPSDTIEATRSGGAGCSGTTPVPVFTEWATTDMTAHVSPSFALIDSQSVLTPGIPYDYDYTTRWSFAPA